MFVRRDKVCRGRTEDMRSYASVAVALSTDHGFPFWAAGGRIFEGWAVTCQGQAHRGIELLEEGLSAWRATGAKLWLPIFLALKAQAQAKGGYGEVALQTIEQAITVSNETNERWAIAEVLRLKADLLLASGLARRDEIEELLVDSLEIARTQKARSWELRTACDLARLRQEQGRWNEAASLLRRVMASSLKASSHRILSAQRCSLIVALLNSQRAHNALQKSATWQEV